MYICDACKKDCNRTINVFITSELCPDCYEKWKTGELYREKMARKKAEEKKNEVESNKEGE